MFVRCFCDWKRSDAINLGQLNVFKNPERRILKALNTWSPIGISYSRSFIIVGPYSSAITDENGILYKPERHKN